MLWENRAPSFRHEGSAPRAYPSPGSWSVVCQPCPPKHPSPCNVQQMGKPLASCSCEISIRSDSQQVMFSQALHRQWHLAWCSAVLERSFVPRIELSALLAICPCKVASDLSFILPGPACRVSRPVFISVCSALLGTMLPLPPLGWVWLFQFCCTGTESSCEATDACSAEIHLLNKLHETFRLGNCTFQDEARNPCPDTTSVYAATIFPLSPSSSPENHLFFLSEWREDCRHCFHY